MAYISRIHGTCPECEGWGKKVNHFDLPERKIKQEQSMEIKYPTRSDGKSYDWNERCPVCMGFGQ